MTTKEIKETIISALRFQIDELGKTRDRFESSLPNTMDDINTAIWTKSRLLLQLKRGEINVVFRDDDDDLKRRAIEKHNTRTEQEIADDAVLNEGELKFEHDREDL